MNQIKLIVGLANPGAEYAKTRHNAGAWLIEALIRQQSSSLKAEAKFFGLVGKTHFGSQEVKLLIPTTFMNLSGKAVRAMAQFYQIKPDEILVVHDELDLNPGNAKFKLGGGHGGHNGLKDIIAQLGNDRNFHRLRIGIGHPGDRNKVVSFVLNAPSKPEQHLIDEAIDYALRYLPEYVKGEMNAAMSKMNSFKAEQSKFLNE